MTKKLEQSGNPGRIRSLILLGLALLVITLAVYWQVGNHEFLNYDDNDYVTENSHVAAGLTGPSVAWAFTSLEAANWHPVTWLSHMADVSFYGMNPRGHHLTNLFIHTASALLLFLLLLRLTGAPWQSVFVAALFALHPLHVESVAWVSERKDLLSAFFGFLSLLFYADYAVRRKGAAYLLSTLAFALGLMAKPMLVTLPLLMLLIDFWPLGRFGTNGRHTSERSTRFSGRLAPLVKEKIPFMTCSLLSAAVTVYAQQKWGAISDLQAMPLGLRVENALTAYGTYLAKTFWPRDLAVFYPIPVSIPLWQAICSMGALLVVSVAVIRFRRRHPWLPVGWFWFLLTLLPVIGLVQVGSQAMADRYTYIPLIGLFIMVAWGVPALAERLPYRQGILGTVAGAALLALAAVTWQQLQYWRDDISLYRHDLQVTTGNYLMHNHLGIIYRYKGDLDGAIREYGEAIRIEPNFAESHNNLGIALAGKGNLEGAIREFREALAINPDYPQAHNNLGVTLADMGDLDGAIREYRATLAINPTDAEASSNLERALTQRGR